MLHRRKRGFIDDFAIDVFNLFIAFYEKLFTTKLRNHAQGMTSIKELGVDFSQD